MSRDKAAATSEDRSRWEREYGSGGYREKWDTLDAAADLVGFVAAGTTPEGETALDLGCGAGSNSVFMATVGLRVFGIDLSRAALLIAAGRATDAGVSVGWQVGSVLALPLRDQSIGLAFDRGCLHHIAPAGWPLYAREVHRVLKPRGRLLLHGGRNAGEGATYAVDAESVSAVFPAAGFQVGEVLPLTSRSDSGSIPASLVLLTRD